MADLAFTVRRGAGAAGRERASGSRRRPDGRRDQPDPGVGGRAADGGDVAGAPARPGGRSARARRQHRHGRRVPACRGARHPAARRCADCSSRPASSTSSARAWRLRWPAPMPSGPSASWCTGTPSSRSSPSCPAAIATTCSSGSCCAPSWPTRTRPARSSCTASRPAWLADHGLVVDAVRHARRPATGRPPPATSSTTSRSPPLLTARATDPLAEALARMPKARQGGAAHHRPRRTSRCVAATGGASPPGSGGHAGGSRAGRAMAGGELSVACCELVLRSPGRATPTPPSTPRPRRKALMDLQAASGARGAPGARRRDRSRASVRRSCSPAASTRPPRRSRSRPSEGQVAGREQPLIDASGHRALLSALRGELPARPTSPGGPSGSARLPG